MPILQGRAAIGDVPPRLVELWQSLDEGARNSVLRESFEKLFEIADGRSSKSDPDARRKLNEALEREVYSSLRKDPELAPLVDRLKPIFHALPRTLQARVATAFALTPPNEDDPPAVLRCLLENAGVVAIKVAQQICEDPDVPKRFRDVLESMRDQNLEVDVLGLWSRVGDSMFHLREVRGQGYEIVGKRLGTGSVKQANLLLDREDEKVPRVMAFVKPGVKEEIGASLNALALDQELRPIVDRVRSMLLRELDLRQEATAFFRMAEHLKPWSFLRVPRVHASSYDVLVRDLSPGTPVSALLRERSLAKDEKLALAETYRALIQAALDPQRFVRGQGFVLTDPHQGNLAFDRDRDGRVMVDLFDPGQYENLRAEEASLFVRLIVHLSGSFWAPKKDRLIDSFTALLVPKGKPPDEVRAKLADAWKKVESSGAKEGDAGVFLRAWLFAAADRGVPIPDAYFGVAKMLHTIDSQCRELGLSNVIKDEVSRLFRGQMRFSKAVGHLFS